MGLYQGFLNVPLDVVASVFDVDPHGSTGLLDISFGDTIEYRQMLFAHALGTLIDLEVEDPEDRYAVVNRAHIIQQNLIFNGAGFKPVECLSHRAPAYAVLFAVLLLCKAVSRRVFPSESTCSQAFDDDLPKTLPPDLVFHRRVGVCSLFS